MNIEIVYRGPLATGLIDGRIPFAKGKSVAVPENLAAALLREQPDFWTGPAAVKAQPAAKAQLQPKE